MRRLLAIVLGLSCVGAYAGAQALLGDQRADRAAVRFEAVEVFVDSLDRPLAAYQIELVAKTANVLIVDVGGSGHPAFLPSPYFDPAAMRNRKIIIANFSIGRDLPRGLSRVARIGVQVTGGEKPEFASNLVVAATVEGTQIPANVYLVSVAGP